MAVINITKENFAQEVLHSEKPVLLDFWASWCGPCKKETRNLAKLHEKYKEKGLTVLGIFVWDKKEKLSKAIKKYDITWPQILDTDNIACKSYGVSGIPYIILFAPYGTILKRKLRGEKMIRIIDEIMDLSLIHI